MRLQTLRIHSFSYSVTPLQHLRPKAKEKGPIPTLTQMSTFWETEILCFHFAARGFPKHQQQVCFY